MFSPKKNLKYRKMQKKIKKLYNRNIFEKKDRKFRCAKFVIVILFFAKCFFYISEFIFIYLIN